MRHAKEYKRGSRAKAAVFFTVLMAAMVFSLIIPLRPTTSVREKRDLTKFPEFSTQSLVNGEYFKGIDDWFSDTFPARDFFLEINNKVRELYGIQTVVIHGEVTQGDDIPDAPFTGK